MLVIEWHFVATECHYDLIEWHYITHRMVLCFIISLKHFSLI
jgi:hypothetical protein